MVIVVIVSAIIISAPQHDSNVQGPSNNFAKGVSLSPRSYNSPDFNEFFQKAKQAGTIVSWAGDWNDLNNENNGAAVVASLSSTYEYDEVVELQFFQQSSGALLKPLNNETMLSYENSVVAFTEKYKPKYLALGIEVNVLYEKSSSDFQKFVELYNSTYDAVKNVSPQTRIFTIFQLEKMKGLNGGLLGGVNDPSKSEWNMLELFPKMDLVALTTYPGLIYKNPSEIPLDYYSEIQKHTTKPVAFTEIGWHSDPHPEGWESSMEEQAQFVTTFFNLSDNLNKQLAIWSFLYDQETVEPFNNMGLWTANDEAKTAWNTWINAK